jgi:hypothetical protein
MEKSVNFNPAKALAELARLWDRSHILLWALAAGTFIGFVALAAGALTGSPSFVQANDTASPWLLLASIMFTALAGLKHYQHRTIQTVSLVPVETQCFYHKAVQSDGSVNTQISIRMDVFSISDKSIWLSDVKLLRPRSHATVLSKAVTLKDPLTKLHGGYALPPGLKTEGSVDLMIQEDLTDQIARQGVILCIKDQFGHRHYLKLTNIRRAS